MYLQSKMPIIELLIWYKIKCRNPRSVYFIFQYTLETTSKYSLMKHFEILSYLHASLNDKVFVPFLNFKTFVSCLIFNIRFYFITWNKLALFVILPAYREKNAIVFLSERTIIKAKHNQIYNRFQMVFIFSSNFRNRIYAQKTRPYVRTMMASLIKFTVSEM